MGLWLSYSHKYTIFREGVGKKTALHILLYERGISDIFDDYRNR